MSNLIPEVRADKDGKLVTRHVRAETIEPARKDFPTPVVGGVTPKKSEDFNEVKAMLTNILEHYLVLSEGGGDSDNEDGGDEDDFWRMDDDDESELDWDPNELLSLSSLEKALSKLPERTITRMLAKIDERPNVDDYEIALLHALTYEGSSSQLIEYMTYLYDGVSDLFPNRDTLGDPDVNTYTIIRDYMQGLRNYESVGYTLPEDIYEATDEDHVLMNALHHLNSEIGDGEGNVEPEIGLIVMERPESAQDVIDIVESRGTRDATLIREMLESETPSVRSGLL